MNETYPTTAQADAVRRTVWLGGAQWAGKTTVAALLAARYGMIVYAYDYHDARSHHDRALARPRRYPVMAADRSGGAEDPDRWIRRSVSGRVDQDKQIFIERFDMVLDDLAALPVAPVVAEGFGLRPELVAPLLDSPRRAVFLVPTSQWIAHQVQHLPRAGAPQGVTDPRTSQRNRLERDRLLADDVRASAMALGLTVIEIDGQRGPFELADQVADLFSPFLPRWLYPPKP